MRCLERAVNGLRDAPRLFHEHFGSRLGCARSEAHPTLFVDLARHVFSAAHVGDLIMIGSTSQLYDVVGDMKQYFHQESHPSALCQFHRRSWVHGTCVAMTPSGSCRLHDM